MAYDTYRTRINVSGGTERERLINQNKQDIVDNFKKNLSYKLVQKLSANSTDVIDTDSWIVDDSKDKELKTITLMPDQTLSSGDYILWNSEYWLNLITDYQGDIYYRGSIQKCVSSLKWLDKDGIEQEAWFTYRLDFYRGSGTHDDKVLIMPSERRYIFIQNNDDTSKIGKDKRFIFDGRAWKVTAIDRTLTGLIYLELVEEQVKENKDNLELRIADYINTSTNNTNLI